MDIRNGYQIDDLQLVLAEMKAAVPNLAISVDWTDEYEGRIPTVVFTIKAENRPEITSKPWGAPVIRDAVTAAIQDVCDGSPSAEIQVWIEKVENCPVTAFS